MILIAPPRRLMTMLGFRSTNPYADPVLGAFSRKRGRWLGSLHLAPHGAVPLRVVGSRKEPDAEALRLAGSLATQYERLAPAVAAALFEHYEPGRDAWRNGELEDMVDSYPELSTPDEVWAHVRVALVDIDRSRRAYPIEIRLNVTWDEEHTLGVRIRDGELVCLSGSTETW